MQSTVHTHPTNTHIVCYNYNMYAIQGYTLLQDSDELDRFVHSMKEYTEDELDDSKPRRHLTAEEKLCKCLLELLDTEQEYIKVCSVELTLTISFSLYFTQDLNKLVSRYLIPLKAESFITPVEVRVIAIFSLSMYEKHLCVYIAHNTVWKHFGNHKVPK